MIRKPLTFYKRKKQVITENIEEGILQYCCKDLKKAMEKYDTGKRFPNKSYREYNGSILSFSNGELRIPTHQENGSYYYHNIDKMVIHFCPFCGCEINGLVNLDEEK